MKRHFQYNWWKYLLILILPVIIWTSVFDILAQPKRSEQVRILFVGEGLDTQALQQDIADQIPSLTEQQILEVTVAAATPAGLSYTEFLTAQCFNYDILILSESYLHNNVGQGVFSRLTDDLLAAFPEVPVYTETVEGVQLAFGFVLFSGTEQNPFSACYTRTDTCYLFISPESAHFETQNGNGIAEDDAALKAAQYLLEEIS